MAAPSKKTFTTLQVGRGFAAIAVVMFHANSFFLPERLHPGEIASRAFNMGYAGVEYFFVLSGFIMVLSHGHQFGDRRFMPAFMRKRLVRIVPFYWLVLLALIAMRLLQSGGSGADAQLSLQNILHSMFLIPKPDGSPFLINAAWTLSHEFLFYFVFALLFLSVRAGAAVFALWMAGVLVASIWPGARYPLNFLFSIYNLLFLLGVLAALFYRRIPVPLARLAAIAGLLGFFAVGLLEAYGIVVPDHGVRTVLFGLSAFLIVAGLAKLEQAGRISAGRFLVFLGDASYSIYLVHGIALAIAARLLLSTGVNSAFSPAITFAIITVFATATGCIVHLLVERPLISRLRRSRSFPNRIADSA